VLGLGVVAAVAVLVPPGRRGVGGRAIGSWAIGSWAIGSWAIGSWAVAAATGAALLAGLAGPATYAVETAATPHQGGIVTAGPSTGAGFPGGGRMRGGRANGAPLPPGAPSSQFPDGADADQAGAPGFGPGGPGREQTGAALAALLTAANTRWAAATVGSQGAASMMLSTGTAVMAIGGFVGSDPYPTLEQFQAYVTNGEVHYFVRGGMGGGPGRGNTAITTWVQQHYTPQTVDGQTVYDLTVPAH
jgi:hypothetical protein